MSATQDNDSIGYREAKRILDLQGEAREVINRYRGIETLWDRMKMKSPGHLILTLFEVVEDNSISEILAHLKALYPEQWTTAATAPSPDQPGEMPENEKPEVQPSIVVDPSLENDDEDEQSQAVA